MFGLKARLLRLITSIENKIADMDNVSSNILVSCTRDGISDSVERSNHYELELPSNIKQAWQNQEPYVSLNPVARPISPKAGEYSLSEENLPMKDQTNRTTTSSRIADKSLSYRIKSTSSNSINCDRTCNHDFGEGVAEAQGKFVHVRKKRIHKLAY